MTTIPDQEGKGAGGGGWRVPALGLLIAAAVLAAYSGSFRCPMLFDDVPSIVDNPSLRSLTTAFSPVARSTVSGRPVVNATFALNYAFGGLGVAGYHFVNVGILVLSAIALFGIVRRTLAHAGWREPTAPAFSVALLWAVHPLLTGAVTYIVQRAESLMGLFYLATLYCFIRGAGAAGRAGRAWFALAAAACILGMGTKEVMVSAPLIVLLYDRTFLAGTFLGALRARRGAYLALAATWIAVPFLVASAHGRGGTAGFGAGMTWRQYGLTQLPAVYHYVLLALWPRRLVFDYGCNIVAPSLSLIPYAAAVAGLLAATAWALARKPALGFLGVAFFAILAPSSSIVPVVTETIAEHRMYLPLISVVVLVVLAAYRWLGPAALGLSVAAAAALGFCTWERNTVYRSEESLWADTAEKVPGNERAQNNLGNMLAKVPGRNADAIARFEEALRILPAYSDAHYNLGLALGKVPGREAEALEQFEAAVKYDPDSVEARNNYGNSLAKAGRTAEAIVQFKEALRLDPRHTAAYFNLGNALSSLGRQEDAVAQYRAAIALDPGHVEAHFNLGNALIALGRKSDAVAEYEEAVRLRPGYAEAHYNLGNALRALGQDDRATSEFRDAVRIKPGFADARTNLGEELEAGQSLAGAIEQYAEVARLDPRDPEAHFNLGRALEKAGRAGEAAAEFEEVLRIRPGDAAAAGHLARIRARP